MDGWMDACVHACMYVCVCVYMYKRPNCGGYEINIDHTMHETPEDWTHVAQKILQWWTDVETLINGLRFWFRISVLYIIHQSTWTRNFVSTTVRTSKLTNFWFNKKRAL